MNIQELISKIAITTPFVIHKEIDEYGNRVYKFDTRIMFGDYTYIAVKQEFATEEKARSMFHDMLMGPHEIIPVSITSTAIFV